MKIQNKLKLIQIHPMNQMIYLIKIMIFKTNKNEILMKILILNLKSKIMKTLVRLI